MSEVQMKIRLPVDLKGWVERSARENRRTMTAEIVFRLEQSRAAVNGGEEFDDRIPAVDEVATAGVGAPAIATTTDEGSISNV